MDAGRWPTTAEAYQDQVLIGEGATSTVVQSKTKDNDSVAIKKIKLSVKENLLALATSEVRVWNSLRHPNIVRYYTSFVVSDEVWVVSEFMHVGSLRDIMKFSYPKGLPEHFVRPILLQTLLGLQYIHSTGHIHRDIKAGNLLMNSTGHVKLTDFGISSPLRKSNGKVKALKTFAGTPCWMAPEVIEQNKSGYTVKADLWSLGITVIELLQGEPPYSTLSPVKVVLAVMNNDPPKLSKQTKVSNKLKNLLADCLQKSPEKRVSATRLLKRRYFKKAPGPEYLQENLLNDLPPLNARYAELVAQRTQKIQVLPDTVDDDESKV